MGVGNGRVGVRPKWKGFWAEAQHAQKPQAGSKPGELHSGTFGKKTIGGMLSDSHFKILPHSYNPELLPGDVIAYIMFSE